MNDRTREFPSARPSAPILENFHSLSFWIWFFKRIESRYSLLQPAAIWLRRYKEKEVTKYEFPSKHLVKVNSTLIHFLNQSNVIELIEIYINISLQFFTLLMAVLASFVGCTSVSGSTLSTPLIRTHFCITFNFTGVKLLTAIYRLKIRIAFSRTFKMNAEWSPSVASLLDDLNAVINPKNNRN